MQGDRLGSVADCGGGVCRLEGDRRSVRKLTRRRRRGLRSRSPPAPQRWSPINLPRSHPNRPPRSQPPPSSFRSLLRADTLRRDLSRLRPHLPLPHPATPRPVSQKRASNVRGRPNTRLLAAIANRPLHTGQTGIRSALRAHAEAVRLKT